jgi:hypothetical protein
MNSCGVDDTVGQEPSPVSPCHAVAPVPVETGV